MVIPAKVNQREFPNILGNVDATLKDLVLAYIAYTGRLYPKQKEIFSARIKHLLFKEGNCYEEGKIFGPLLTLSDDFIHRTLQYHNETYFSPRDDLVYRKRVILHESPNEYFSENVNRRFPGMKHGRVAGPTKTRPEFSISFAMDANVVAIGEMHQTIMRNENGFIPSMSTRSFPKIHIPKEEFVLSGPLVVVRDSQKGSNFAHLLFDWLPRILHFRDEFPELWSSSYFLMGANRAPIHDLIFAQLQTRYEIDPSRFLFARDPVKFAPRGGVFTFSDQALAQRTRPMQYGNPHTVKLMLDWKQGMQIAPSPVRKIYITRRDAAARRIVNEHEFLPVLGRRGYHIVALSEFSLEEQISLVSHAEVIAGPHGMGMSFLFFSAVHPKIFEIFHPFRGTLEYKMLADISEFQYDFAIGLPIEEGRLDYEIDPDFVQQWLPG